MKKYVTHYWLVNLCLLLLGLLSTLVSYAQTRYREGLDFPGVAGATTYTLSQGGSYSFSGLVQTPGDPQDAFKVIVASGYKITRAVLQASGGADQQQPSGFLSFADGASGYPVAAFTTDEGLNVTRTGDLAANTAGTPYIGLIDVDRSTGTAWAIVLTVVATGGNACIPPTLPTVSATQAAICAGATTTLSIQSGSLNDATTWRWYSGSCGGTLVGTGSAIQVSPTSTTTYYVRGEGGCVTTPGSCASQEITVSAPPVPPAVSPLSYCQGAAATSLTANGINLRFYTTPTGGSPLAGAPTPSTAQPGTTTFFVTQTNGTGCESNRSALTVRVNPLPDAPGVQPVTYCQSATASPLTATASMGSTLRWYSPGGTPLASAPTPSTTVPATTTFFVSQTNGFGCEGPRAAITVTVNPLPVVAITGLASAYCKDAPAITLTGSPAEGTFTVNGTSAIQVVPANLAPGNYTVAYSYTNSSGCSATTSQIVTINPLPLVSITPSALTGCAGTLITLSAQGADGYVWNTGATTTAIPVTATGTGVYSVTGTTSGCSASATQSITIYPLPATPTLLTQQGQSYPGGQSSVSVDVNSGPVNLVVGGCSGTITWSGPSNTSGNSSPIVVSTERVGTFVYTATCTSMQGCTSGPASATVTVGGRLTVLHRDVDNYADNNAIQPLLQLQNQSNSALPLSRLTLRYYLTLEGNSALSNLSVNYAQVGNQNVRLRYVPLSAAQQGATGYVEVSFTVGAGNLAGGANSGPIQTYFARGDYGTLVEPNDYSYNPVRDQLTATQRITAYYDGVLIAGIEPGTNTQIRAVRALTESRNGPSATQINTVLEVRNEGTVAINYSDLRARYYFTSDGNERLQVELDEGNVSTQLVALSQPVAGANYYLEIRYNQAGQLAPGASTGAIRYRISKPQGGRFDQTNDYSYQERPQERSQNSRVVVYVGSEVVWGTPPTGTGARVATSQEPGTELQVTVLGNPVRSDKVSVQITGAGGEPLQLQLVSAQGRLITQQQIAAPQATEKHDLSLEGQGPGIFLLQVSTPTQSWTVRVLKAE